jgi:DnaJ-domain-containing protein 1
VSVTDYFALLNEPRRPWLEAEVLKGKFLALTAEVHPDRFHNSPEAEKTAANARYTELNTAYRTLSSTKDRLLHLLTLETGAKPKEIQNIPSGAMELFVEVGQICKQLDYFLIEKVKSQSPIVKAQLYQRGLEWTDEVQSLQERLQEQQAELEEELQRLNATWEKAPAIGDAARAGALPLARVEDIYRTFSYLNKWTGQLKERFTQLAI